MHLFRFDKEAVMVSDNFPMNYRCTPVSSKEYIIENFPHPKPYLYHLTDIPVHPRDYLKIANEDYGEGDCFQTELLFAK
jgi:hypothetical protein